MKKVLYIDCHWSIFNEMFSCLVFRKRKKQPCLKVASYFIEYWYSSVLYLYSDSTIYKITLSFLYYPVLCFSLAFFVNWNDIHICSYMYNPHICIYVCVHILYIYIYIQVSVITLLVYILFPIIVWLTLCNDTLQCDPPMHGI